MRKRIDTKQPEDVFVFVSLSVEECYRLLELVPDEAFTDHRIRNSLANAVTVDPTVGYWYNEVITHFTVEDAVNGLDENIEMVHDDVRAELTAKYIRDIDLSHAQQVFMGDTWQWDLSNAVREEALPPALW